MPVLTLAYVKGEFWRFLFFSEEYEQRIALRWDGDDSQGEDEEDGQDENDYLQDLH